MKLGSKQLRCKITAQNARAVDSVRRNESVVAFILCARNI